MIKPKKDQNSQGPLVEEGVQIADEDKTRAKRITKPPRKLNDYDYVYVTQVVGSDESPEI
jgi:hypothetical protein